MINKQITSEMKKLILLLFFVSIITSCNNTEDIIIGSWAVDSAYYNEEPLIWDLYSNGITFYDDHSCVLPFNNYIKLENCEKGKWNIEKENNYEYLKITSTNSIFNRSFKINKIEFKNIKNSNIKNYHIILTSDSLKLECFKTI